MIRKCLIITGLFMSLSGWNATAQRSQIYKDPEWIFKEALDLYRKEKYAAAQNLFREFKNRREELVSRASLADASYYEAACALELFHEDARALIGRFVLEYPESPMVARARFLLAKSWFRDKKYKDAIREFKSIEPEQLTRAEWYEYKYKLGYSLFSTNDKDNARLLFSEIKDAESPYRIPSIYYFAHISYEQKKWDVALREFQKIEKEKLFSSMIPYYMAQIYYFQERYPEVIRYAKPLADTTSGKFAPPIRRILAESYYKTKDYKGAVTAYNKYLDGGGSLDRSGEYNFGTSLYFTADYPTAASRLQKVVAEDDSISQNASYYIADSYMKFGDKRKALDAFKTTWKYKFNESLREEALFNFAKLSFELDFDPYNEAITALKEYLNTYPSSPRTDEIYKFLAEVYMTTKNYREALVSIERMKSKSKRFREAYQRIAWFRGVELFNEGQYAEAMKMFALSGKENLNKEIYASGIYWTGEAFYRLKNYEEAIEAYDEFLQTPGALQTPWYYTTYYNLGYIFYRQKNYERAALEFRKFADAKSAEPKLRTDALIRIADCFYALRQMDRALEFYTKAMESGKTEQDYALLQKATVLNLTGKTADQIATLKRLTKDHPSTVYMAEALYELGAAQMKLNFLTEAAPNLEKVTSDYPTSIWNKKALLKLGLLWYNKENDEKALGYYKRLLQEYPGTDEADEAVMYVKNIYVEAGNVDDFQDFISSIKGVDVSKGSLDSATYQSAENRMLKGDCKKAIVEFDKYIQRFPDGLFVLNARYYRGDCHYKGSAWDEALADLRYIIDAAPGSFTETALYQAGEIYMFKKDCPAAKAVYERLEKITEVKETRSLVYKNLMYCNAEMGNHDDAVKYASLVLQDDKTDAVLSDWANIISARAWYAKGDRDKASVFYKKLAKTSSEFGAESRYMLFMLLYDKGEYAECEKKILSQVGQMSGYANWLAKTFILLSDCYVKQKNYFQAKATLQSVIDNHDGAELVQLAKEKLKQAEVEEEAQKIRQQNPDLEFDLNGNQ